MAESTEETLERYREALILIVSMMEPLGWKCPTHTCEGCEFEYNEALRTAMNVLAGLEPEAHWGPAHTNEQMMNCNGACPVCIDHHPTYAEVEAAYAAFGFVKDGNMWRRGTAF